MEERQTRSSQKALPEWACGFESRPGHPHNGIFAAVATPGWFDRDADGFTDPALSADLLGLLCALLVLLQIALIIVAMQGFRQRWNVEAERPRREADPAPA